jgi:hypothetical protein
MTSNQTSHFLTDLKETGKLHPVVQRLSMIEE